jgi:hypothetical protein
MIVVGLVTGVRCRLRERFVTGRPTCRPISVDRLYFVGYTVFTLGIGDFVPGDGDVATGDHRRHRHRSGDGHACRSPTSFPVASAAAGRRELAAYISVAGIEPDRQSCEPAGTEADFEGLDDHFVELTTRLTALAAGNTSRTRSCTSSTPAILVEFRSAQRRQSRSGSPSSSASGWTRSVRMRASESVRLPLERALDAFLDTLGESRLPPAEPAPTGVARHGTSRASAFPQSHEAEYADAEEPTRRRRALVAGLLVDDGWPDGAHCRHDDRA